MRRFRTLDIYNFWNRNAPMSLKQKQIRQSNQVSTYGRQRKTNAIQSNPMKSNLPQGERISTPMDREKELRRPMPAKSRQAQSSQARPKQLCRI